MIIDEIHAVAQTKRGAHLSLTLERLEHLVGAPGAAHRPVRDAAPARGGRPLPGRRRARLHRGRHRPAQAARPPDPGAGRGHDRARPRASPLDELSQDGTADAARSIWPAIYPELLELVQQHRSTIIFVNARRAAERLALRLNELAGEDGEPAEIARAHHGSLAREERLVVEEMLKSGELPCLVATSSLELGIDMGAVDLVLQVESPKSVTAGLQRIGRAGHGVGEVSKGRIFPKFRADLLECAVVTKRMRSAEIETTVVPRNPLDVLAQQIVAMVATGDEWRVPELHDRVRRAYPYAELSRELLDSVLDMLDGRYPSRGVRRAAAADRVGPRRGHDPRAQGRAPARGDQRGHDPRPRPVRRAPARRPPRRRARRGDGLRGAARADVHARRVDLADRGDHARPRDRHARRPALPGAVPFWKGDSVGRPVELGRAIGEFSRWAVDREPHELIEAGYDLDERAATNLVALPARAARGDARRAERPHRRGRALPRRDRRLAAVRAHAVRRPRARRLGAGPERAHPRPVRPRGRRDLVGRRDHRPPARRRRAARRRARDGRAGRDRGAGRR